MEVIKIKKCVVTGGAGFIGSHLLDVLVQRDCEVIVADNLFTGKIENIKRHLQTPTVKFFNISILSDNLSTVFSDADVVFHLAAIPRIRYSTKYPLITNKVNVEGTLNVLEAVRKSNVERVVFSSSSSVYGPQPILPLKEDMEPNPISHYAVQKLIGEKYMQLYGELYGIKTIILRYFNVYGPRDDPKIWPPRLIPKTIYELINDKQPIVYGNGKQSRDFTYVKDVVDATLMAAEAKEENLYNYPINVGTGISTTVMDVLELINNFLNKKMNPIFKKKLEEPPHTQADTRKAGIVMGWSHQTDLSKGIESTINWIMKTYKN